MKKTHNNMMKDNTSITYKWETYGPCSLCYGDQFGVMIIQTQNKHHKIHLLIKDDNNSWTGFADIFDKKQCQDLIHILKWFKKIIVLNEGYYEIWNKNFS